MASTPSASALSAVLRCRGKIWPRNPPTKRPATAGYSLGLAVGAVRDFPDERRRSNQTSAWEAFLQGQLVVVGRRVTVEYKSPRVDGKMLRGKKIGENNKLDYPNLWQSPKDARSATHGVQNTLVRQLARRLTPNLPLCSKILLITQYKTYAATICNTVFAQELSRLPAGAIKVSIASPCLMENAGQVLRTLTGTFLSLAALVSELLLLGKSSSMDGVSHQIGRNIKNDQEVRLKNLNSQ